MVKGRGEIIAVSAPSGTGKTTIIKNILKKFPQITFSISATTRPKRVVEKNGVEYFFISEKEFLKKIENNEFVEWEKFYDYYYGTFKSTIEENINSGISILLEIDVKGALSLKSIYPESHLIYIKPPSFEELVKRLSERKTENKDDFKKRIERAEMELNHTNKFDYVIINKDLNKAIEETSELINKILKKEK